MQCPKCQYIRQPTDHAPDWQCPNCGVAYEKVRVNPVNNTARETKPGAKASSGLTFKKIRILILLTILAVVALNSWLSVVRSTDWDRSLWVIVYPINADGSKESDEYIRTLSNESYNTVQQFFINEIERYGLSVNNPVEIRLGPVIKEMPPLPPKDRNVLKTMLWSLKMRYWSFAVDKYDGPRPDIQVFVLYHQLEENKLLEHSTGLQKGLVSIVHAFSAKKMTEQNNVIIAHEILHTLGATDKYDLRNGQPIFPHGYADPERNPRLPQKLAEIMGGRIPISETEAEIPKNLNHALVGIKTAKEIGWLATE